MEADLQPLNHGLNSAWRLAQDRGRWKQLVETATLQSRHARDDDDDSRARLVQEVGVAKLGDAYCKPVGNTGGYYFHNGNTSRSAQSITLMPRTIE